MTIPMWSCSTRAIFGGMGLKSHSATASTGSKFKPIDKNTLDFDVIDCMADPDDPWFASSELIRDPATFLRKCRPSTVLPGPLSTLTPTLATSLMGMGIHRTRPSSHDEACTVGKLFGVYKDESFARLIQWPKELNESTPDLLCALPTRHDIHQFILQNSYMDEDDGRDYFFQFAMADDIHRHFAARVRGIGIL